MIGGQRAAWSGGGDLEPVSSYGDEEAAAHIRTPASAVFSAPLTFHLRCPHTSQITQRLAKVHICFPESGSRPVAGQIGSQRGTRSRRKKCGKHRNTITLQPERTDPLTELPTANQIVNEARGHSTGLRSAHYLLTFKSKLKLLRRIKKRIK